MQPEKWVMKELQTGREARKGQKSDEKGKENTIIINDENKGKRKR